MSAVQQRAWSALSDRLRRTLAPEVAERFVGGTHTRRFADNLLPGFPAGQVEVLRGQLASGAGGELAPTSSGKRRAHAPYSSAALAVNAFGRWLGSETRLQVAGLGGFDQPLSIEHKLRIKRGGGEANLDCVLQGPGLLVGIESKLTETLAAHSPVAWRPPYRSVEMAALVSEQWADLLRDSLARAWTPEHLGLEQLVKHALALASHADGRETHLVYCYWEPLDGDRIDEVVAHRAEVAELTTRVQGARPAFHAISYTDLLAEWAGLDAQPAWLEQHLNELSQRYVLPVALWGQEG